MLCIMLCSVLYFFLHYYYCEMLNRMYFVRLRRFDTGSVTQLEITEIPSLAE